MPTKKGRKSKAWIIFEELVRRLLITAGYRKFTGSPLGVRAAGAGLEFLGRGGWHQIDVPVEWPFQVPLSQPIVSLVEAKFQQKTVGIDVIREAVAVLLDISQNVFTAAGPLDEIVSAKQHIHYQYAVASASGFSEEAIRFAFAHQIYLLDYSPFPFLRPYFEYLEKVRGSIPTASQDRFRADIQEEFARGIQLPEGIFRPGDTIKSSVFGLLGDQYPVHFLGVDASADDLRRANDRLCRIHYENNLRSISLDGRAILYFSLPLILVQLLLNKGDTWRDRVNMKLQFMDRILLLLPEEIGFQRITIRLDQDWLRRYAEQREHRDND